MADNTLTANARGATAIASGDTLTVTLRKWGAEGVRIKCNTGATTDLVVSRVAKRADQHLLSSDADEKYHLDPGETIDLFGSIDDKILSFRLAPSTAAETVFSFIVLKT